MGFHPHLAAAQSPAQGEALQKELRELRDGQRSLKGDSRARVTVVEYSDYQCPFCGRHARETLAALEAEYIRTGQVKYVFQDFPIGSIHRLAFKAHEGAHCAGEQGKYWEMHGRLFEDQKATGRRLLRVREVWALIRRGRARTRSRIRRASRRRDTGPSGSAGG